MADHSRSSTVANKSSNTFGKHSQGMGFDVSFRSENEQELARGIHPRVKTRGYHWGYSGLEHRAP